MPPSSSFKRPHWLQSPTNGHISSVNALGQRTEVTAHVLYSAEAAARVWGNPHHGTVSMKQKWIACIYAMAVRF